MGNKIKVGDKVKVSKDAPRMYVPYWRNEKFCATLIVKEVNDGNASVLFEGENPYKTVQRIIPTKYLIKVDAEDAKFKFGDKVKCLLDSRIYEVMGKTGKYHYALNGYDKEVHEDCLELYTSNKQTDAEEYAHIRQMEAEFDELRKAHLDRTLNPEEYYTYEVTIDNVAINWQSYKANLAKDVVLKVVNKYEDPKIAADYAVSVAKAVVEGLKRK